MTHSTLLLDRDAAGSPPVARQAPVSTLRMGDDKAMLRAAAELTRDLSKPRPAIYWTDMLLSALAGWGALLVAATTASTAVMLVAGLVSVLALYRAVMFIHEVSHMKHAALPHFRLGWNALVGVPMLTPSIMYEGVHNLHHAKTRYGTADDPEYLPLALMKPWTLPLFVLVAALAPVGFLIRFAVLGPLSLLSPSLRHLVVTRFSALAINPAFRRRVPEDETQRRHAERVEAATSAFALALVAATLTGVLPWRGFAVYMLVLSCVGVVNQLRTLVAHLWENDGEAMSVTAQYLDSVNVPPPALLPFLWAPVGLRYHALHHLLPSLPYHALGEAHRRLSQRLEGDSPYHKSSHAGLAGLVWRIMRRTMGAR